MKAYNQLSNQEKYETIYKLYVEQNKSFADIAELFSTYPNKLRRDAKKLNIPIRNKSEAQKNALSTGKHNHPTKGKNRPQSVKDKIGTSVMNAWEDLDESELEHRKKLAKSNWEKLSQDQRDNMQRNANNAVRVASKTGSKLEKYLLKALLQDGHSVDFHKEQTLVNTKLQIDIFLPKLNTAIEVDGPSHFAPVWGDNALKKNISYDQKKEGLIIGKGWHLIRIKQTKDFSPARAKKCYGLLREALNNLVNLSGIQSITIED